MCMYIRTYELQNILEAGLRLTVCLEAAIKSQVSLAAGT